MGRWHQEELRHALERKGWNIVAVHSGDDHHISGSWEIRRSTHRPTLFIDFDGLDDLKCLPMAQSYGCGVRGFPAVSLYFRKQRSRHLWLADLQTFIAGIEAIDTGGEAAESAVPSMGW